MNRLPSLILRFRALSAVRRGLLYTAAVLFGLFLLVLLAANRNSQSVPRPHGVPAIADRPSAEFYPSTDSRFLAPSAKEFAARAPAQPTSGPYLSGLGDVAGTAGEPRISYSAELAVATDEFVHSRASLEEILERHHGYVAKLRMLGQPAGSLLSATLRIPSSEYSSTLSDLKSIGRVEREEESADEITQQHGDLEARLMNAQNTEQRLQRMLQNPTAKGINPATFERQLATVRAEIERMQAEHRAFENRTVFSSVFFSLREEIALPAVTLGTQLRNAAVHGFSEAVTSFSAILIFAMNYGPSLFLWTVILFLPARFVWRRAPALCAHK